MRVRLSSGMIAPLVFLLLAFSLLLLTGCGGSSSGCADFVYNTSPFINPEPLSGTGGGGPPETFSGCLGYTNPATFQFTDSDGIF